VSLEKRSNPDVRLETGGNSDMEKSGEAMVPVQKPETIEYIRYDRLPWKKTVFSDEFCTCPKPTRTVFDVCSWCLATKGISADRLEESNRFRAEQILANSDVVQLPIEGRPITKVQPTKERFPACALHRIIRSCEWPAVIRNQRLYPHIKEFARHLWKALTRKLDLRGNVHVPDVTSNQLETPYRKAPQHLGISYDIYCLM
jgi:hypothetical protein